MPNLFVDDESTIDLDFDDGSRIVLRKYSDAGIEEEVEGEMIRVQLEQGPKKNEPVAREARIRQGNLRLVQLMVLKIIDPSGKEQRAPIGMVTLRRFDRAALALIMDTITQYNPPFSQLRQETEATS